MRNMSFALTTGQILKRTKTVTRRLGWTFLRPGDLICAVEKSQGLKKGEKVKRLVTLLVTGVHREPLNDLLAPNGWDEVAREGFPGMSPDDFVDFFCASHNCKPNAIVTRIAFSYVEKVKP